MWSSRRARLRLGEASRRPGGLLLLVVVVLLAGLLLVVHEGIGAQASDGKASESPSGVVGEEGSAKESTSTSTGATEVAEGRVLPKINRTRKFIIDEFTARHPLVRQELLSRGFVELKTQRERHERNRVFDFKWTFGWAKVSPSQYINHFRSYPEVGYKVLLTKNLRKLSPSNSMGVSSSRPEEGAVSSAAWSPEWWPRAYIVFSGGVNPHEHHLDHGKWKIETEDGEDATKRRNTPLSLYALLSGLPDERGAFLEDFRRGQAAAAPAPASTSTSTSPNRSEEAILEVNEAKEDSAQAVDAVLPFPHFDCRGEECEIVEQKDLGAASTLPKGVVGTVFDPQPSIDGTGNIWIVKPGFLSRGWGIRVFNDSQEALDYIDAAVDHGKGEPFVIQKYIERPFVAQKRKFDIRQFVLVTSLEPLTVFMFEKSYLRFCHVEYSHDDLENKFAHLTNHQVQKDFEGKKVIQETQWSIKTFQSYLDREVGRNEVWRKEIEPKIRALVIDSLRTWPIYDHRERSFELLGLDIMLDQELNPYLLEINTNPGLHLLTDVVEDHHPAAVAGIFNVTMDRPDVWKDLPNFRLNDPELPELTRLLGGWRLIYRGSSLPE